MPTNQIDTQFVNELLAATRDVFKTIVFQDVQTSSPITGEALRPGANVVGTVAFAGKTSGLVAFYSMLDGANAITTSMLGIDLLCTKVGLSEAWLADLDRRAPGLFQVARQIVA